MWYEGDILDECKELLNQGSGLQRTFSPGTAGKSKKGEGKSNFKGKHESQTQHSRKGAKGYFR